MPFPDRPAENADPWYDERETYDQAIEDAVTTAQTKLAGIATGATANSPDATLLARANHTGTQTAATISDFDTEVGNHTDVAANTAARHTHANSAILAATTASFLTADETKLDGIATGATANATNAELRARSSHTGTQLASTISDLSATVSAVTDVVNNTAARHTHSNKALLDTYTQTEANIADAVTKKHAHANSAVLDATTASFLTADKTKLDGIEALADVTDAANVAAAGAVMTTDAPELIRDTMGTALVAGTNVTITPSDGSDTITIAASGGGGGADAPYIPPVAHHTSDYINTSTNGLGNGGSGTFAASANIIYFYPIFVNYPLTPDKVSIEVTTGSTAGSARVGIFTYVQSTRVMTLVEDYGVAATVSIGQKDLTPVTGTSIGPAWYWIGVWFNEACTVRAVSNRKVSIGVNSITAIGNNAGITHSLTYSTFSASYSLAANQFTSSLMAVGISD